MGTNPGAWLSVLSPGGVILVLSLCLLAILGVATFMVVAHKYGHKAGEVRISWKEISVRWSQEAQQEESDALEEAPGDTPAVDRPRAATSESVTPDGGDAVA